VLSSKPGRERPYPLSLFIFRRDLRLEDNSALNQALLHSQRVLPCFIFDPRQIRPHSYQSQPALTFMLQSLNDLHGQLQRRGSGLTLFHGLPAEVIRRLHQQKKIQAVFVNRDYTPFSRQRDQEIAVLCENLGIRFVSLPDALLTEPEQVLTKGYKPYQVFTAFHHKASQITPPLPQALAAGILIAMESDATPYEFPKTLIETQAAGRTGAIGLLAALKRHQNYQAERDHPAMAATSGLSAHVKFGTCSVREVYYAVVDELGDGHPLLRQLYWRDFFTHIAYHHPWVFGRAFIAKFQQIQWSNNKDWFAAWCAGATGFPIVDAGMRQLNSTGFMHNRLRMIAASFLVKDLHIDWRWGERYFAQTLVDYDPCVNNGNWQWAASTGCDAQPYFRIFNPWLQQQKFDAQCQFIYRWIPELRDYPEKTIHQWHQSYQGNQYPRPIVDHNQQALEAKARFKAVS